MQLDPFYPIVPDTAWLKRLLPAGLKLVQLRIKDAPADIVRTEIGEALRLCADAGCQLVVNDYWREAIEAGADFVHLGQEDLSGADLGAIRDAGLKLGISTHSDEELGIALAAGPDYVALGPVYPTLLKKMPWAPQGLDRVTAWKAKVPCPLVAIGGLTPDRAAGVLEAGADTLAVITDIVTHEQPEARAETWVEITEPWRRRLSPHTRAGRQ
ncbi:thiamine-phosphate diphosphorylase [Methyloceanibacter stevinii]|uniref:Thiamine-phosphate synthase n=1 Tax=Methyloceanibacter stevinii TaxID=1774970 RepID=A0A1E3VSW2_9HYPH|nr:thiamine phosphate synthase [Methyloceanibacter stevinii]ODR96607.1 thiamine-phosphate diphosphorylase [Methyloceanibacter stevinii]